MSYIELPVDLAAKRYGLAEEAIESYSTAELQPYAIAILRTPEAANKVRACVRHITITDPCEAAHGQEVTFPLGQITIKRDLGGTERYWVRCL